MSQIMVMEIIDTCDLAGPIPGFIKPFDRCPTRMINPNQLNGTAASPEWLSASKKLIDPEALKPIKKIVNKSRSYLIGIRLPFPIQGMVFVPKEMISQVDILRSMGTSAGGALLVPKDINPAR